MKSEKMVKSRRNAWVNWTILTLFLICIPSFVHADIGDLLLKFHPYMMAQEQYSNNIFLSPNGAKIADYITNVYPGVLFSALSEQTYKMDLDFTGGYNYYLKNHDFSYWGARGRLDSWYAVASNLTFRLRDYLIRSDQAKEELYTNQYNAQGQFIGNTQQEPFLVSTVRGVQAIYFRNVVEPSMEYRFGRENLLSVLYRNNTYRNENPQFENSMENTFRPRLVYWLDIRNGIILDYYLTSYTYQVSPNQLVNRVTPRYTYRFDPKTSIFVEYRFEYQDFQSPGIDYYVNNPSVGIDYRFSPTLIGHAQAGYFWQVPKLGSTESGPSFDFNLVKRSGMTLFTAAFRGGYQEDYATAENLGFVQYYMGYGTIRHQLTERLSVSFVGYLRKDIYASPSNQKDWQWSIRGGPTYLLFRWLAATLEAGYRGTNSNISTNDYNEFSVMFRLTLAQPGYQPSMMTFPGYQPGAMISQPGISGPPGYR